MKQDYISIPITKTPQQIQEGHESVTARMNAGLARDLNALDYEWKLVKRWPSKGAPVFAAESKVLNGITGKKVKIQLHRFAWGLHEPRKDATKMFVIPKDGNALNCDINNLEKLSQEQWDARNHRKTDDYLTDEEREWVDAHSIKIGKSRGSLYRDAIRLMIANESGDPFQD
ncbi:MAG: hypothetical protein O2960_25870 [Verrucomicrobia bacterium]|nr:hypothetical protein [Verrucomicrobiota bacterium]